MTTPPAPVPANVAAATAATTTPSKGGVRAVDVIVAASVVGAFALLAMKTLSCEQRLDELEREIDETKLMRSLSTSDDRTRREARVLGAVERPPPPAEEAAAEAAAAEPADDGRRGAAEPPVDDEDVEASDVDDVEEDPPAVDDEAPKDEEEEGPPAQTVPVRSSRRSK